MMMKDSLSAQGRGDAYVCALHERIATRIFHICACVLKCSKPHWAAETYAHVRVILRWRMLVAL
jgi:hypothetical protein